MAQNATNIPALVEEHVGGAGHSPLWGSARNIGIVEIVPTKNTNKKNTISQRKPRYSPATMGKSFDMRVMYTHQNTQP